MLKLIMYKESCWWLFCDSKKLLLIYNPKSQLFRESCLTKSPVLQKSLFLFLVDNPKLSESEKLTYETFYFIFCLIYFAQF